MSSDSFGEESDRTVQDYQTSAGLVNGKDLSKSPSNGVHKKVMNSDSRSSTPKPAVCPRLPHRMKERKLVHFRAVGNGVDCKPVQRSSSVNNILPSEDRFTRHRTILQSDRYKGLVVTPIGRDEPPREKTRSIDSSHESTHSASSCSADTYDGKESNPQHSRTSSADNSFSDSSWSGLSHRMHQTRITNHSNQTNNNKREPVDHSDVIRKTLAKDFSEIMIKSRSEELKYKQKVCQYLSAEGKVRDYLLSTEKHHPFQFSSDTESSFCSDGNSASSDVIASEHTISELDDKVLLAVLSNLSTRDLCNASAVCRKWNTLCWNSELWSCIDLSGCRQDTNMIIEIILKKLSRVSPYACLVIHKWKLNACRNLSDESLRMIGRRCPELKYLELARCPLVTGQGIAEIFSNCPNLSLLNIASCSGVKKIDLSLSNGVAYGENASFLQLRYVDISECSVDDAGLDTIARSSSFMEYLYLRRCEAITDKGVIAVANYCTGIRELSISDCSNVTDSGLRFFVKKCNELRYLSVAKCFITDETVKYIAKYCKKVRYLNMHMCHSITDEGVARVARSCEKLRALDVGKCEKITDTSLNFIAVNNTQLRRLSIKGCERITDSGLRKLATHCRSLKHLNVQECDFSFETFLYLRQRCVSCVIEHTKPEFY